MFTDLGSFLTWLGTAGGMGVVSALVLTNWPWLAAQGPGRQQLVELVVALICGVLSRVALTYVPAGVIEQLQPWFMLIVTAAGVVLGQKATISKVSPYKTPDQK